MLFVPISLLLEKKDRDYQVSGLACTQTAGLGRTVLECSNSY